MRHFLHAGACVAAICVAGAAHAQETTSSIRGSVTSGGAPVAGAMVTVVHVPSGTTSTTSTGADGTFTAAGLRVGGPFTVKISASGYTDYSVTDISLTAGQATSVPIALEATGNAIVVTATRVGAANLASGPGSSHGRDEIGTIASVTKDVREIVRRDPFATLDPGQSRGVMIAGQNARLNKFSVDGLRFSDNFGLNVGGLPTARGPVPLDAIEQLSVKVAPFDISEGDFQGGAINVVLRSGTNKLTGSASYTYNSDKLVGTRSLTSNLSLDFKSRTYGGFLAGPLVKDKLFFAFSYEHLAEGTPITIGTAGFANVVPNLTDTQIANISSIAQSVYNYDTLGVQRTTLETDEKWTAKIDWNIVEGQRLAVTFIHDNSNNSSTAGFSSIAPVSPALGLESDNYRRPERVFSTVAQLSSDWADNFHTEVRANYRKYDLTPVPFGEFPFSQMQVCLDPTNPTAAPGNSSIVCSQGAGATPGAARLYFGPDRFRHFNYVRTKQYGVDFAARWNLGSVAMKLTGAWSHLDVANAFTSDALGTYYFDSVADFQAGRASTFGFAGSITGDLNDVLASFSYDQYTVGLQGTYEPTSKLSITAGARVDTYGGITPPPVNTFFVARYPGLANNHVINGKLVAQPRIGISWKPTRDLRVRAGFGLFAGGSPDVFLGNSYSVSGVFANSFTINRNADGVGCQGTISLALCSAALDNVNGRTFSPLVLDYLRTNVGSLSLANTNSMDPKYKMESTWKSSFSVDWSPSSLGFLGGGWNFGGDIYYGFVNNAPLYKDLRLMRPTTVNGTLPDGRPRYTTLTSTSSNTDLYLTNTTQGHSLVAVARIDKRFDFGLDLGASYTFQDVTDVSSMNGTTASGTYGQNAMVDPNIAAYGTSIYQIRNSWKFTLDYAHAFFGDNKTRFSLFGELRSGIPYSLTMNDPTLVNSHSSVFGTAGSANRYLLYVPTATDTLVAFDTAATKTAFDAFIAANGLEKYRGKIIGKNTQRSPHFFKVDAHIDQDIPVPIFSGAKIKLFADMENVLNFINKDWGSLRQVTFPYLAPLVNVSCVTVGTNTCAQYKYSNFQNPVINNQTRTSVWAVRFGAKVEF